MKVLVLLLLVFAAALPAAVPTPESFFGHQMGADKSSLEWAKVVAYFERLLAESPRVRVQRIGNSTEGRPMIAAYFAAPETLQQLDQYKQIQARLADPRGLRAEEQARLVGQGKTVVLITCSIHSTEVASTHTAVEWAYRMATANDAKTRAILDNVILILVPSLNPDGIDIVTNWYRRTLDTPYEGTTPPELYQKYVGHDNNRDWYIFSQAETRNVISQLHNVWHPQIVYDVHQQGASASRMFVPPWMDPIDPNVDPIIAQMANAIGMNMASDLTAAGKTGIAVNALYDFWTPARHYQSYHGGVRILTESASVRLSSPVTIAREQINRTAQGYDPQQSSWNHLEPWLGGEWHLRDIVDYQLIAFESLLHYAAVKREDMLQAFTRVGQRQSARTSLYSYVIGPQSDPGAARKLLDTLAFGQVEIEQAKDNFLAGGRQYPAGSYLIKMAQPYSGWAKTLLERQQYPDLRLYPGGPPKRPYDVTAQTLPLLMGVQVEAIEQPFTAKTERASTFSPVAAPGARSIDEFRQVVRQPRIALYRSFIPQMDEGWTRYMLDEFGWRYSRAFNAEIRGGNLRSKYDVIVFPDQSASSIQVGYLPEAMPKEFTGGLGKEGAEALKQFVQDGGTLLFFNDSCDYALAQLGIPVKDVTKGVSNRELYAPGSLLWVNRTGNHPVTTALPDRFAIWHEQSPAFDVTGTDAKVLLQYPDQDLLASGWLLGEKYLAGKAALVDVPVGKGHVILYGLRPQYRAQSYLTYKLIFNAFRWAAGTP